MEGLDVGPKVGLGVGLEVGELVVGVVGVASSAGEPVGSKVEVVVASQVSGLMVKTPLSSV